MNSSGHKQAVLDYVLANPGATSTDIQSAYKKMPSGTISGRLSKFVSDGTLVRAGSPGSYRYYEPGKAPQDGAQLPLLAARKRRARKSNGTGAGVLISVAVGRNHTETMTIDEARAVWKQLSSIFGHAV